MEANVLTVREAAARLQVTADIIGRWIREGKLKAWMPAGRRTGYRIAEIELETCSAPPFARLGRKRQRKYPIREVVRPAPLLGLWRARQEQHCTQSELAQRVGLTRRTVSDLESGLRVPRLSTIKRLAQALGTTPENLVEPAESELLTADERRVEDG